MERYVTADIVMFTGEQTRAGDVKHELKPRTGDASIGSKDNWNKPDQ